MNRMGLAIVLTIAVVTGVVFGVYARLDIDIAALFYNASRNLFRVNAQLWVQYTRMAVRWLVVLFAAPAFLAIVGKLILPRRRMLIGGRAAIFLVLTLALGPGLLTTVILKNHWGRSRPIDVTEFQGSDRFTPWWDPRGTCPDNCSFVAGEPSVAFWTMAAAAVAPPQWRLLAYGATFALGAADGVLRIAAGAHFFSDVVFAGVFMFLVLWVLHGLIFRWRPTRATDGEIEGPLEQAGDALRSAVAAVMRRVGRGKSERS